ncbi:MAG: orotate phosphoribosyltransferase [Spirochaetaceae bacterium]|jgi:orotate phosphoribosyltransferase|nr:orotate phosphoribosyltransferase [Spirochaetaceae bacterium]
MSNVISILKECGALLEGHFLLSSGRHSDKYFQCAKLFKHPQKASLALEAVALKIKADLKSGVLAADAVVGPALGGIIVSYELARALSLPAFFTERDENGVMTLRRGFEDARGLKIIIAEDVVTTGKSYRECAAALEKAGASVTALSCVVDRRGEGEKAPPFPFYPAARVEAENWEAEICPLCKKGIPAVKPGSRKI